MRDMKAKKSLINKFGGIQGNKKIVKNTSLVQLYSLCYSNKYALRSVFTLSALKPSGLGVVSWKFAKSVTLKSLRELSITQIRAKI